MKRIQIIFVFFILLVLFSAETCSDGHVEIAREDKTISVFQEMENEFIKDELSSETLSAFEKRAIQKLKDVADLINIYSDTCLSVQFRMQANQMIQENFIDKKALQNFYKDFELQEDTVNNYLVFLRNSGNIKTEINGISVLERLQKKSFMNYSGEIQFSQKIFEPDSINTNSANYIQRKIEIQAVKTEKNFGEKTVDIWEVFLGEIKL